MSPIEKINGSMVPQTFDDLRVYNELTGKLASQDGRIIGHHGTTANNAHAIESDGFMNNTCEEGDYGVWFADGDVPGVAEARAAKKAQELGEQEIAIITAELIHPRPDARGRKQWLARAEQVEILNVEYRSLTGE